MNLKFEKNKLEKELQRSGTYFDFKRNIRNEFNELRDDSQSPVFRLRGIYHETNSYISVKTDDATQYSKKKIPCILCLYSDTKLIKKNDVVEYKNKTYKVNGIVDVQNWNIVADISLEEM